MIYAPDKKSRAALTTMLRLQEDSLWGVSPTNVTFPHALLRRSPGGAYFADIDYTHKRSSRWEPVVHLDRLLALARAKGKEQIGSDENTRSVLLSLLDFWLENDFRSKSWWYRTIKVPRQLLAVGIMLDGHLSGRQRRKLRSISSRGVLHPCQAHGVRAHTGANHLDVLHNTLSHALFTRQAFLLLKTRALLEKDLSLPDRKKTTRRAEGVQEDWSFFQHGPLLVSGSYGLVYADRAVHMLEIFSNASLRLPRHSEDFLVDFFLRGVRYAVHKQNSHYLTNGRSFSRPGGETLALLEHALAALLRLRPGRQELQAFRAHLAGERNTPFSGTKYFPSSFFLASHWQGTYMAAKGAHQDTINSEFFNGENPLGRNLGHGGVTTYQHTGAEYAGISSVWDFSMLPGTTAHKEEDDDLRSRQEAEQYRSKTRHCGGASSEEGGVGALYVDLEPKDGPSSRHFYVTNGKGLMVCLGTDIRAPRSGKPVLTTLDQTYAQHPTHRNASLAGLQDVSADAGAVYNAAFAYYRLDSSPAAVLRASVERVGGNFARNNRNFDQPEEKTIFKIYFEHKENSTNGSFAYAVAANQDGLAPPHANALPIARITNQHWVQAVQFIDGSGAVVLHERGSRWSSGTKNYSSTHKPALFLFGPENPDSHNHNRAFL